jgi:hypothetical protein
MILACCCTCSQCSAAEYQGYVAQLKAALHAGCCSTWSASSFLDSGHHANPQLPLTRSKWCFPDLRHTCAALLQAVDHVKPGDVPVGSPTAQQACGMEARSVVSVYAQGMLSVQSLLSSRSVVPNYTMMSPGTMVSCYEGASSYRLNTGFCKLHTAQRLRRHHDSSFRDEAVNNACPCQQRPLHPCNIPASSRLEGPR